MDDVSVVLLPDGAHGDEVRRMLGTWARSGIITPVLVVRKDGVVESPPEPIRVTATLVGAEDDQQVDLFSFLGRYRLAIVRIVLAQLVATAESGDVELSRLGQTLAKTVKSALPLDPGGTPVTRLHRTALIIPTTGVAGVNQDILLPSWEANVIISPEDRPDVDRPSVFVRAAENYAGHATAAIAMGAGVIRGVPDGGLDEVTSDSSTSPDDVVVARTSIRTVIGDGVVDVLARKTLDPAALGPSGPAAVMPSVHASTEPDFLVDQSVRAILESPHWASSPEPQLQPPAVTQDGVLSSIGAAARFNLRTTAAVAAWTVSRGRDRLDAAATETLVGSDSGSLVTVGPRVMDNIDQATAERLEAHRRELDEKVTYEASRGSPPEPATWSELRTLAFALCDGSESSLIEEPRQLGKRELLRPGDVAPHPAVFVVDDDRVVHPTDPPAMARYRQELDERAAALHGEVVHLGSALVAVRTQLEQVPPMPTEPEQPLPDPAGNVEHAGPAPSAGPATPQAPSGPTPAERRRALEEQETALAVQLQQREAALAQHEDRRHSFNQWFEEVSSSVLWQVGDDVARRLWEQEANRRQYAQKDAGATVPATERLERTRRRLLRVWWSTIPLTVVALAVLFYLTKQGEWALLMTEEGEPDWQRATIIAVGIVLLAVVILTLTNHHFYKAVRRHDYEVERALALQRYRSEHFIWAGKELVRLRSLFEGWKDWTAIIGEVVHRTWEPPNEKYEDLPDDIVQRLPAAVSVAQPQREELELPASLLAGAYQSLYQPGWAAHAFGDAYERFAADLLVPDNSGHLAVDTDAAAAANSPRAQLVDFWRNGTAREWLGNQRLERLKELSYEGRLRVPDRVVERIGPYSDGNVLSEPDYFAPTTASSTTLALDAFGPRARNENLHYIQRTWIWLPQAAVQGLEGAHVQDGSGRAGVAARTATGPTALRVDVSARVRPSRLAVFTDDGQESGRAENGAPDETVQSAFARVGQAGDATASTDDFI